MDDDVHVSCCGTSSRPVTHQTSSREAGRNFGFQVSPFLCEGRGGSITVMPHSGLDTLVRWPKLPECARVQANGTSVSNLPPGKYVATVRDVIGTYECGVDVPRLDASVITSYTTRPCTSFPWNGEVRAHVDNCQRGARFLWSNGSVTNEPVLMNARPGKYTLTLLHTPLSVVSASAPATVESLL
jgi:hypothetical protein